MRIIPKCPDGAKLIPLTRGRYTIVDEGDFDWLNQWKWHLSVVAKGTLFYAVRQQRSKTIKNKKGQGKQVFIAMHRLIMNAPPDKDVDHRFHDGLDNRRENMRICTRSENLQNQRRTLKSSDFKGVWWDESKKKWIAEIVVNKKRCRLGSFTSEIEAAKSYDDKALRSFREFACLNFPKNKEIPLTSIS